ncbi:MAG TPA: zinc ribbon domain-containing protein [Candidatus Limnocylindria bacterium]
MRSFREESGKEGSPAATSTAIAGDDRHCTNCGKPLADGAKFCASCGTPVAPS